MINRERENREETHKQVEPREFIELGFLEKRMCLGRHHIQTIILIAKAAR